LTDERLVGAGPGLSLADFMFICKCGLTAFSESNPHPFFITSYVLMDPTASSSSGMFAVLPNGRIRTVVMSPAEQRVGRLLKTWWLLRASPFMRRQLKAMKAKKMQERLRARRRRCRAIRLRNRRVMKKALTTIRQMKKAQKAMKERMREMEQRIALLEEHFPVMPEPNLFSPDPEPAKPPSFTLMCMVGGNDVVALEVQPSDTIDDVKAKMRAERGIGDDVQFSVFWDGDEVGGLTLAELGIDSSEILEFRFAA
jgi:hypothetical protein